MPTTLTRTYQVADHDLIFQEPDSQYVLRVKDLPNEERPREKLSELGAQHLSVAELLAVLWGTGSKNEDVLTMARRTLKEYGEKAITNEMNAKRLAETANIPLNKACQVVAGFELGRRFYGAQAGKSAQIRTARQAYNYMKDIGQSKKEQLRGLYLNSRYQVIHDELISVGSLTSNVVHPREVFQPAIERGAVAVVIAHNHPSGRIEPTEADIVVTEQLIAAGEVLGIELLDHLVITATRFTSIIDTLNR